jgi:hypothetical protein
VRLVGGAAGRALAAAQGRALRDLLEVLVEKEVGQGPTRREVGHDDLDASGTGRDPDESC